MSISSFCPEACGFHDENRHHSPGRKGGDYFRTAATQLNISASVICPYIQAVALAEGDELYHEGTLRVNLVYNKFITPFARIRGRFCPFEASVDRREVKRRGGIYFRAFPAGFWMMLPKM